MLSTFRSLLSLLAAGPGRLPRKGRRGRFARRRSLNPDVEGELKKLERYRDEHLKLAMQQLEAYGGALCMMDFLVAATIHRSMSLLRGFCSLLREQNFMTAASVVRLQLDNALRLHAASLVPDLSEFVASVMQGTHVRQQRTRDGHLMTDKFLVDSLSQVHPWVKLLYAGTSGYVHLSEKHLFGPFKLTGKAGAFTTEVSGKDVNVSDEHRLEAIQAMSAVTDIVLRHVYGWVVTKEDPLHPSVVEARKRAEAEMGDS